MPIEFDGVNSKVSADKLQGQTGTTITIESGHSLSGSGAGLTSLPAANLTGTLPAISGASLTSLPGLTSKVGSFTRDTTLSDGNVSYTGVGFQPTAIIVNAADSGAVGKASWGFGDSAKVAKSINDYSPVTADTWTNMSDLLAIIEGHPTKTRVTIVSYDADGFTLNYYAGGSGPSGTFTCNYICFK
jgi:hypothetical protein